MALKRVWIGSPNYSSGNSGRRLLVLHSSEGAQTWQSLGNFFANPSSKVSSHVGIDDQRGTIGEYVKRSNSSWTASNANRVAVQAELCTPSGASANWSRNTWMNQHHNMLLNAADWLREESKATGVPLVALTPSQAQGNGRGVCQHKDLGSWGGGHVDCGPGFPIDYVMDLAKGTASKPPTKKVEYMDSNFYLEFAPGENNQPSGHTTIVLSNEQSSGDYRIRFGCRKPQRIRVDAFGMANPAPFNIGYDAGPQGFNIGKGCQMMVVHIDAPNTPGEPIAVAIGKK